MAEWLGTAVRVDALAIIVGSLVIVLSAIIQSFATRYLRGDTRRGWFFAMTNLVTAFTLLLVVANTVIVFAIAWIGVGVSLVLLLLTYRSLAEARVGAARTALLFGIGDLALVVGIGALVASAGGDVTFARLGEVAATLPIEWQLAVAMLLVVAGFARSSQLPFHSWLPATLSAPTPVSALMHAGVVNAAAILLFRFAPAIASHATVMIIVFLVGAATLAYASAVRLVKPDVKGRLVYSTMAQMGFMVMTLGLGAFAAAIFHLVAHSLFKSNLFLGAGMAVRAHAERRDLPLPKSSTRTTIAAAIAVATIVVVAVLAASRALLSPESSAASTGLVLFVALTGIVTLASTLATDFSWRTAVVGIATIAAIGVGYTAFLAVFSSALVVDATVVGAPVWMLALPAAALLALAVLSRAGSGSLRSFVYARALAASAAPSPSSKGSM